jgi:hypothetical protein
MRRVFGPVSHGSYTLRDIRPTRVDKLGPIKKQVGPLNLWTNRWLALSGNCLYDFETQSEAIPLGIIPLVCVMAKLRSDKKVGCFEVRGKKGAQVSNARFYAANRLVEKKQDRVLYLVSISPPSTISNWYTVYLSFLSHNLLQILQANNVDEAQTWVNHINHYSVDIASEDADSEAVGDERLARLRVGEEPSGAFSTPSRIGTSVADVLSISTVFISEDMSTPLCEVLRTECGCPELTDLSPSAGEGNYFVL